MRKTRKKYLGLVEEEKAEIAPVLERGVKKDVFFGGTNYVIYEVNFETMLYLSERERAFKAKVERETGIVAKHPYYLVAKLVNKDAPAPKYNIIPVKKYIYVTDNEKILRDLDALFSVWKNSKMKQFARYIKEHNLNDEETEELRQKFLSEIGKAYLELEYIRQNADKLDLRRTNYDNAKYYLSIQFKKANSEQYEISHLRKEVPNVIAIEPVERKRKERRDKEVEEFLKGANHAFEFVYYRKRNEA